MFGKKLFLILGGYLAGNVVASLYTGKKGKEIKTDLKKAKKEGKDETKVLFENIWTTNLSFFDDIKNALYNEKTKKIISEKKDLLLSSVEEYKEEGKKIIAEFQEKGIDYSGEMKEKLENLYATKKEEFTEMIKKETPKKAKELKGKLATAYKEVQEKIKK